MTFEFATAGRIVFGRGSVREWGARLSGFGRNALLVTGHSSDRAESLSAVLRRNGVDCRLFSVDGEPTIQRVVAGAKTALAQPCDLVIGLGGGSAIDAAKAIAAMATNPGDLLDYLEVIGRGQSISRAPLPCVAIPTSAGTGTEVTRNAVLTSPEFQVKVSLRSLLLLPKLAVVDPELTVSLPPQLTASTGLDALTQLIEPYVSLKSTPLTDGFCVEGIRRIARSLRAACDNGGDLDAREDMALASLLGGLALANAGLGAVHGFAGPIGGMFKAPHGAVCAALLPLVTSANLMALRERKPDSPVLARYDEIARLLTGRPQATANDALIWLRKLLSDLNIPPLNRWGIHRHAIPTLVDKAAQSSSMKGNPIALIHAELTAILENAV
jgi:alcohol dehydrogenase class IV